VFHAEPAVSAELAAVVPAPPPAREGQETSLPQPAEAAASTTDATATDVAVDVVREAWPSSPRLVASAADEVPVPDEPVAAPQEHVAPECTTSRGGIEPTRLVIGSARYGSARYGLARYGSLRYRAGSLARLGSFKSLSQLVSS
jgi:hypothetical protein